MFVYLYKNKYKFQIKTHQILNLKKIFKKKLTTIKTLNVTMRCVVCYKIREKKKEKKNHYDHFKNRSNFFCLFETTF